MDGYRPYGPSLWGQSSNVREGALLMRTGGGQAYARPRHHWREITVLDEPGDGNLVLCCGGRRRRKRGRRSHAGEAWRPCATAPSEMHDPRRQRTPPHSPKPCLLAGPSPLGLHSSRSQTRHHFDPAALCLSHEAFQHRPPRMSAPNVLNAQPVTRKRSRNLAADHYRSSLPPTLPTV